MKYLGYAFFNQLFKFMNSHPVLWVLFICLSLAIVISIMRADKIPFSEVFFTKPILITVGGAIALVVIVSILTWMAAG
jgi:hypothetical protein